MHGAPTSPPHTTLFQPLPSTSPHCAGATATGCTCAHTGKQRERAGRSAGWGPGRPGTNAAPTSPGCPHPFTAGPRQSASRPAASPSAASRQAGCPARMDVLLDWLGRAVLTALRCAAPLPGAHLVSLAHAAPLWAFPCRSRCATTKRRAGSPAGSATIPATRPAPEPTAATTSELNGASGPAGCE